MTDRELMQQALDALELLAWYENPATKVQVRKPRNGGPIVTMYPHKVATEAAAPLRERLAQPEQCQYPECKCATENPCLKELAQPKQEPVAHVYLFEPNGRPRVAWDNAKDIKIGDKLYTTPPQRKPEQEPVAHTLNCVCGAVWDVSPDGVEEMVHAPNPPQRKPLTDEQIDAEWRELDGEASPLFKRVIRKFARAIEAKLKEKNNG